MSALHHHFPATVNSLPACTLGIWPTPIRELKLESPELNGHPNSIIYVKREDLSGEEYGGNKVRTLEFIFGKAMKQGATHIWTIGAYGSNHAVASALHAHKAELIPAAILAPIQPPTRVNGSTDSV